MAEVRGVHGIVPARLGHRPGAFAGSLQPAGHRHHPCPNGRRQRRAGDAQCDRPDPQRPDRGGGPVAKSPRARRRDLDRRHWQDRPSRLRLRPRASVLPGRRRPLQPDAAELSDALPRRRRDDRAHRRDGVALCRPQSARRDRGRQRDRARSRRHRTLCRRAWPSGHGAARPRRRRRGRALRQLLGRRRRHFVQGLHDARSRPAAARDRHRPPPRRPHHRPSLRRHLS